MHYLQQN